MQLATPLRKPLSCIYLYNRLGFGPGSSYLLRCAQSVLASLPRRSITLLLMRQEKRLRGRHATHSLTFADRRTLDLIDWDRVDLLSVTLAL